MNIKKMILMPSNLKTKKYKMIVDYENFGKNHTKTV